MKNSGIFKETATNENKNRHKDSGGDISPFGGSHVICKNEAVTLYHGSKSWMWKSD